MESYMSRSLKSFWGSLELRATPSPKRKKTAMILSAIFAKHAGQIVPSMMPERTRLQRCFSARKTEFTASWKCWIQRVIADSKTSHSILSISSDIQTIIRSQRLRYPTKYFNFKFRTQLLLLCFTINLCINIPLFTSFSCFSDPFMLDLLQYGLVLILQPDQCLVEHTLVPHRIHFRLIQSLDRR
ncbi:uncharacterized protein LOC109822714 isoform X2 [Asparagus officinalis]|uniref:uncharacterized protein LOC109822714 isoform X2 n=1 Tax=Asparagus officinalis TaxID=4686 RepID=UPI00098E618B|nr:uncharacterized protein LOC109822714 isoform X2 [Asparagus officinalis]